MAFMVIKIYDNPIMLVSVSYHVKEEKNNNKNKARPI